MHSSIVRESPEVNEIAPPEAVELREVKMQVLNVAVEVGVR